MLEWEDQLFSQSAYIKAVIEATKIWLQIHDDPNIVQKCVEASVPESKLLLRL